MDNLKSAFGTKRTSLPHELLLPSVNPAFRHQTRHPLKLPHIIRHQNGAGRNGMPGYRRVVQTDRRSGEAQRHLNLRVRVHRGAVPGQDAVEAGAERVNQLHVARGGLQTGGAEAHLGVSGSRDRRQHAVLRTGEFQ